MRRREFIVGASAAILSPLAAPAQAQQMPVIGVLAAGGPSSYDLSGFRSGLQDLGYTEAQNLAVEYRWADGHLDRLPGLAADLVRLQVRVVAVVASGFAARAAKGATSTIPIVFGFGLDPVQQGLVASLKRPGGNITGVTSRASELIGKQLALLRELVPRATHIGVLMNSTTVQRESFMNDAQSAASSLGETLEVVDVANGEEIDAAFTRITGDKRVQALLISNDPLFIEQRTRLARLAARFAMPAVYPFREMAEAGGLLSYGPDISARDREAGRYVGRILNGESPAELPVQQMSKFELVVNLKAAKALGLTVSSSLQLLADEVIE